MTHGTIPVACFVAIVWVLGGAMLYYATHATTEYGVVFYIVLGGVLIAQAIYFTYLVGLAVYDIWHRSVMEG